MKTFIFAILCFLISASNVFAGTESLTFAWEKAVIEADLDKFELQYTVDNPSIENPATPEEERVWEHLVDVAYVTGQSSPFTEQATLTSPDGQEMWYWFRIRAMDASENSSDWNYGSAEEPNCKAWIDFKGPEETIQFTVIVNVEPEP